MSPAELVLWLAFGGVGYAYLGYPLLLLALTRLSPGRLAEPENRQSAPPSLTLIVPVHNEQEGIADKLLNTRSLMYADHKLQILFVSDGSTDATTEIIRAHLDPRTRLIELQERAGKAGALNAALEHADCDLVVFSDASIVLDRDALLEIVKPFRDPRIGCVSGEDRVEGSGGEGIYGRYELFLRRQESSLHSIVGASGSFYAQRRALCQRFPPNLAPDFLSVLLTVRQGYRAISWPPATGTMRSLPDPSNEFRRKVRTLLRGMTTLGQYSEMMNPLRYGIFAVELISHKLVRWLVPLFLLVALLLNVVLAGRSRFYGLLLGTQVAFYALSALSLSPWRGVAQSTPVRLSVYLVTVNAAIATAWVKYLMGVRQELWSPTRR